MNSKILIGFFALSLVCRTTSAQTINTIAGVGTAGFSGDGSAATSAEFNSPADVAIDLMGNLYISDEFNYRIRKIDGSGIISTVAGTGTAGYNGDSIAATSAQIGNVVSIAVDAVGRLYLADADNHRVRMIDTSGIIYTIAGTGVAGFSGDGGLATSAELRAPFSVAVDDLGNVYVSDLDAVCVRKINTSGVITTIAGTPDVGGFSGDGGPATAARLTRNTGITVDKWGNLYIADNNVWIRKVNTSGIINTVAGNNTSVYNGDGIIATNASIYGAGGVQADTFGNFYIADDGHYRIRKVNGNDSISTIVGTGVMGFSGDGGLPTSAQISPCLFRVAADGDIYIADAGNNRIRKVSYATDVEDFKSQRNDLRMFPNANNGTFTVVGVVKSNKNVLPVQVLDLKGKVIYSDIVSIKSGKIDKPFKLGDNVAPGHYIFKIETEQGPSTINFEKK
ncbi:MAG: T9SS type A sorting domain-containing protein [Bacteroidetes bacterium]|nr:T9SS type A sorting domain-containing protein [Bacteroidota bacterium]